MVYQKDPQSDEQTVDQRDRLKIGLVVHVSLLLNDRYIDETSYGDGGGSQRVH